MAAYAKSMSEPQVTSRAGNNPLKFKAVAVHGSNPVLSVADANAVLLANQTSHFLDNCAVVFIR